MIKIALLTLMAMAVLGFAACGSDDPLADSSVSGSTGTTTTTTTTPAPTTAPASSASSTIDPSRPSFAGMEASDFDPSKSYTAAIVTDNGEIVIELFAKEVPNTVKNFVYLSRLGFYDGLTFHRVIAGFMAQTGDPTGTGTGGPGYQFADEFHPDLRHDGPGILSMANSGSDTNGSQFFITLGPTLFLDGLTTDGSPKDCRSFQVSCHAVFGKLIEGMDVLGAIHVRDPGLATTDGDVIQTIRIIEE